MLYPDPLKPQSTQRVVLLPGREVQVPKTAMLFRKWSGVIPKDTFGNKPLLDFDGAMMFAELAILRIFEQAGWQGRWVDSYRNKYRIGYWGENITRDLPAKQQATLDSIRTRAGCKGGCFDVFCWRDEIVLFTESKWKRHDRFRKSQRRWLGAALSMGIPLESFLVVEWALQVQEAEER